MEFLIAVDQVVQGNFWFSLTTILILTGWIAVTRYFFRQPTSGNHPGIVALVDLILFPVAILCIGGLVDFGLQIIQLKKLEAQVQFVTHLLTILSIGWCFTRLVEIFILSRSKRVDSASYLPGIQRGLLYGCFLFVGLLIFLNIQGYSITGLYVSTGAAAALIAFAMQRTLGDLFSGIALSIEHPFRLGDWVQLADGSQGQIVDVNWRATRFRTWDNATLIVPNSELAQQGIKNLHGADHVFAPWYKIKVSADVDPRFAKALLLEAALRCKHVLQSPLPSVRLVDVSTIPYTYMVWVHYKNFPSMFAGREELFREIHYGLKEAGIRVASDTHEIHTRRAEVVNITPPTVLSALKGLDLANVLTDNELEQAASMSKQHSFDAGTILVKEGDVASAFDVIVTGIVEASISINSNESKSIDHLKPGQYFGITSMIIDNPSFMRFTTLTDVTLIRIDLDCFRAIISNRPDIADGLAKIVEQRMEAAQKVRLHADMRPQKLTIQEILKRIEKLVR